MEVVWNALVPEAAELVRIPGKAERDDPWMSRSQTRTVAMPDRIQIGAMVSSLSQPRSALSLRLGLPLRRS